MNTLISLILFTAISSAQWALPQGTPTLQMRYPSTPWISPGDTIKQPGTSITILVTDMNNEAHASGDKQTPSQFRASEL